MKKSEDLGKRKEVEEWMKEKILQIEKKKGLLYNRTSPDAQSSLRFRITRNN